MTSDQPWAEESIYYHIYPLGFCGAPARNDFSSLPVNRLEKIQHWLPHIQDLGANALYLGPIFESSAHGYDTANYYEVDRRLGTRKTLADLSSELHKRNMRLILDGVFNHVGRDFWAFKDVQRRGESSPYKGWFSGLRFDTCSPYNDPFTYETWNGHYDLVKLNLNNPEIREHIFEAIHMWEQEFNLDGLRLDAADCLDFEFMTSLHNFCRSMRPDFWLLGEVVHGDYRRWVNPDTLDSVTNYECYKGLYSSLVDRNYFEIAYTLNRQFGAGGVYAGLPLYNFVDNHDVDRVASRLRDPLHLYPLYLLLFTIPGVPSIYYGSEWGLEARRSAKNDTALRPSLDLEVLLKYSPHPNLCHDIARLAGIRKANLALRRGEYRQLYVAHEQFAFARVSGEDFLVILLNASDKPVSFEAHVPPGYKNASDCLNQDEIFNLREAVLRIECIAPHWGRILKLGI